MTTHQYLQKLGIKPDSCIQLAFMIGMAREVTPHYTEFVYRSTPIHNIYRWYNLTRTNPDERKRSEVLDYVVLNNEVYDLNWLSGANWNGWIKQHQLMMILVAPKEELLKKYSERDVQNLEDCCEKKIINEINAGKNPWLGRKQTTMCRFRLINTTTSRAADVIVANVSRKFRREYNAGEMPVSQFAFYLDGKSDEAHRKLHALGIRDYAELAIIEVIE